MISRRIRQKHHGRRRNQEQLSISITQERIKWARKREQEYSGQSKKAVLTE